MRLFTLTLILFCSQLCADQITTKSTVRIAIEAVQLKHWGRFENIVNIEKVSSYPRHSLNRERIVELFNSIDIEAIEFDENSNFSVVRMVEPINMDFEIEFIDQNREGVAVMPRYKHEIVGIHP